MTRLYPMLLFALLVLVVPVESAGQDGQLARLIEVKIVVEDLSSDAKELGVNKDASAVLANGELFEIIDGGNKATAAAIVHGDADAVASTYTDDAYLFAPSTETAHGREAIRAFWKGVIESGVKDVSIGTGEVASSGDLAYAVGTLEVTGTDGSEQHSRYVLVFKKEAGTWKLHLDIWTPSKN